MQGWIKVAERTTSIDAELICSFLHSHGVETHVKNLALVNSIPHMSYTFGGVQIFVAEKDYKNAQELLQDFELAANDKEAADDEEDLPKNELKLSVEKALRSSIIGLIILPGILNFFSIRPLSIAIKGFRDLDFSSRLKLAIAVFANCVSFYVLFVIVHALTIALGK